MLPARANIVILASNYNPSIVSKEWLSRKEVFTGTVSNFLHTPVFALAENDNFNITVDEGRFQVIAKKVTSENLSAIYTIAEKFVNVLPETPYKAIGINYQYAIPSDKYSLETILSPDHTKISKLLSSEYEIGATLRFGYGKFIVTLTIQPSSSKQTQYSMNFNFHSDIADIDELRNRLTLQMEIIEKADIIIRGLSKNA
jgi:hypothetical protein